ncbi:hypothetical protein NHX12_002837 [Muraenolepis orangiensis]|uniref:G-protein coupled receptors family 1 profile domain-containing protein n=1 Tax=Muraenolepis orangiensis TaxID=630683 RepID=A0A9Q0DWW8_9TELE|nr:hypothetical protein NHX12_002837 [Muraenolepis orangiensis]
MSVHLLASTLSSTTDRHNSSDVGPGVKVAPCLLLGACFMVGLPVNIAVIFDICRKYKRYASKVNPNILLLVLNLALVDSVALTTSPLTLYTLVWGFTLGDATCQMMYFILTSCLFIRIIGLPESIEGPRPTAFYSEVLVKMFGDQVLQTPPELDRAHRTLGDKPRPVIVFTDIKPKSWTRRSAYADYCPEVQEQRAAYRNVMAKLYNLGLRPALLYPAKLQITDKEGNKKRFSSAEEAIAFIGDHVSVGRREPQPRSSHGFIWNPTTRNTRFPINKAACLSLHNLTCQETDFI